MILPGFIQAKALNLVVGLHVRVVSVFGKKSNTVCGFFGVFLCGFAVFGPPLRPPPFEAGLFLRRENIQTLQTL